MPFSPEILLRFHLTARLGSRSVRILEKEFGTDSRLRTASVENLTRLIGPARARAVRESLSVQGDAWKEEASLAKRHGIRLIPYTDKAYPKALASIYDPPLVLSVLGDLTPEETAEDPSCLAMVGARRCSVPARMLAERLAGELASAGLTVVSGLARGVDQAVHRGALEAAGRTLAVLGSGLLRPYPPEARPFMERIGKSGAVLSEFPLNAPPLKHHFPRRNRIISGLSRGVLVVEAARDSGSLITADWALEQGRDVLACPGRAGEPLAGGVNRLIRDGAALVETSDDVLEALGLEVSRETGGGQSGALDAGELKGPLRIVWGALGSDPVHADEVGGVTGMEPGQVTAALVQLELMGRAKATGGMHYVRIH